MPRHARIVAAGIPMHAILRGIDRTAIFFAETDNRQFLAALVELARKLTLATAYFFGLHPLLCWKVSSRSLDSRPHPRLPGRSMLGDRAKEKMPPEAMQESRGSVRWPRQPHRKQCLPQPLQRRGRQRNATRAAPTLDQLAPLASRYSWSCCTLSWRLCVLSPEFRVLVTDRRVPA